MNSNDLIVLEQECKNGCGNLLTISKGSSQNTYEASGNRGIVSNSWAFCAEDDPDAFQLLIRGQDGSLASVTPLGNIMWQREEGLASIKAVELVSKGFQVCNFKKIHFLSEF
jgi:hypothetical protein